MNKVFISGSRAISRLNSHVLRRLDNIVRQDLPVLIGDANGADKSVQKYLSSKGCEPVEVFCSGPTCRNNEGGWPTRHIAVRAHSRGAEFFYAKDRVMASEATFGLMIWDGQSTGTLLNILRMVRDGKVAILHTVPEESFIELRGLPDWRRFLSSKSTGLQIEVEKRAALEPPMRLALDGMLTLDSAAAN